MGGVLERSKSSTAAAAAAEEKWFRISEVLPKGLEEVGGL